MSFLGKGLVLSHSFTIHIHSSRNLHTTSRIPSNPYPLTSPFTLSSTSSKYFIKLSSLSTRSFNFSISNYPLSAFPFIISFTSFKHPRSLFTTSLLSPSLPTPIITISSPRSILHTHNYSPLSIRGSSSNSIPKHFPIHICSFALPTCLDLSRYK